MNGVGECKQPGSLANASSFRGFSLRGFSILIVRALCRERNQTDFDEENHRNGLCFLEFFTHP